MHLWTAEKKPPRGSKVAFFDGACGSDRLTFATVLFEVLRDAGYALVMISHEPCETTALLATKVFSFHHVIDNVTEVNKRVQALREVVKRFSYTMENSIAIGDSASDFDMLTVVTHGIAFNPDPGLLRALAKASRGMNVTRVTEVNHAIQTTRPVRTFTAQAPLVYEYKVEEVLPPPIAAAVRTNLEARGYHLF